jgi:hypothetical protein
MIATHKISIRVARERKKKLYLPNRNGGNGKSKSKCQKSDSTELQYAEKYLSYFYIHQYLL